VIQKYGKIINEDGYSPFQTWEKEEQSMKLNEKLALEWWRTPRDMNSIGVTIQQAYLAGFEKAREMASKDALDWDDTELRCMNDCCLKISNRLEGLGEEEVKDE
jgi:hypothetical protein